MLRARRNFSVKQKLLTVSLMVFALVAQPFYGVLSSTIANATPVVAGDVVINEVKPSSTSGDERWVELYNTTGSEIDLSNWRVVRSGTNFGGVVSSGTISAHGFYVLESTSATLPQSSSTPLELWNGPTSSGAKIDTVSYSGVAAGQSYGRTTDGISTFAVFSAPTKGVSNVVTVTPPSIVNITNVDELRAAIEHQADGQTWNISASAGQYGLAPFTSLTVSGQTGWYFPITVNNLTINGIGNPTIYGTGYTANGNWATQNLVSVFGDNVTIDGLTFMPKIEPNKTIEVLGNDFTLRNTVITPNTLTDQGEYDSIDWAGEAKQWGGSLYFSHEGNHTVQNVTINNAGISFRYSPSGTHISFDNVQIVDTTGVDWINNYRYSSGFNGSNSSISGALKVVYHVTSSLDNFQMALDLARSGDVIELDSDITAAKELNLVNDGVTINGNGHTVGAGFDKTGNDNNSILGIKSDNVIVNNIKVDAGSATNDLHGINIYQASNVALNNVTAINGNTGVVVNGSTVTIDGIHTSGNRWHGVNVDKAGSELTMKGANSHSEAANLFVDDRSVGKINDVDHKYMIVASGNADIYTLDTIKPTITLNSPADGAYNPSSYELTANDNNNLAIVTGNLYNGSTLVKSCSARDMYQAVYTLNCAIPNTLADGTYTIRYNAKDTAGNMSTTSTSTFIIDKTAPAAPSLVTQDWYVANGPTKTLSWNASTSNDVVYYEYAEYNNTAPASDTATPSWTKIINAPATTTTDTAWQTSIKIYWRVRAVDQAGNKSAWSETRTIVTDHTNPTSTDDLGQLLRGTVTVNQHIDDNFQAKSGKLRIWKLNSGIADNSKFYAIGDVNVDANGDIAYSLNTSTNLYGDGQYIAKLTATDRAGNAIVTQKNFTVDNTVPTVKAKAESLGDTTNKIFRSISFKLYDAGRIDKVVINGVTKDLTNNIYSDVNGVAPGVFGAVAGTNTLQVYDVAGNVASYTFTLDVASPTATFTYSNDNGNTLTQNDVTVTMTTTEPIQTPSDWTSVDGTHFTRVYSDNGKYSVVITDLAGNVSAAQNFEVKRIDRKAPIISGAIDGSIVKGPVTLSISDPKYQGYDGFGTLKVNGTTVTTVAGANKTYLYTVVANGAYTVVATDKAGNITTISFVVDSIAPTIDSLSIIKDITNEDAITLSGKVFDQNLKNYNVRVYKGDKSGLTTPWIGYTVSENTDGVLANIDISGLSDGNYQVRIWAEDIAGNRIGNLGDNIFIPFTIDRTAPAITGVVDGASYHGAVNVKVTDANFKELNVNGLAAPTNGVDGEAYAYAVTISADGTYTVTAVDEAGNTTSVQFIIDSTAATTIEDVNTTTATPTFRGTATYLVDSEPVPNTELVVVVDGTSYNVTTDVEGKWSLTSTGLTNGRHIINVYTDSAKTIKVGSLSFTTAVPVEESPTTTTSTSENSALIDDNTANTSTNTNTGTIENATNDDTAVLGTQTTKDQNTSDSDSDSDVVSSEEGWNLLGLAWYWWLAIVAAVIAGWWLIVAALRRKKDEE